MISVSFSLSIVSRSPTAESDGDGVDWERSAGGLDEEEELPWELEES